MRRELRELFQKRKELQKDLKMLKNQKNHIKIGVLYHNLLLIILSNGLKSLSIFFFLKVLFMKSHSIQRGSSVILNWLSYMISQIQKIFQIGKRLKFLKPKWEKKTFNLIIRYQKKIISILVLKRLMLV